MATKGRYTPDGLANTEYDYRVFYNTVELEPGKTVRAIRLPATSRIGVFAATVHDRPPPAPEGEVLGGNCTRFTARVGVDDEMADRGSITFTVRVDGEEKVTTQVLTGTSATVPLDVDVTGGKIMELHIGDAGNGIGSDHGDCAAA